jgi:hypothetical protein
VNYSAARSERELREHVGKIFGNYFITERVEPAVINASQAQAATPAVAFWMVRKPKSPTSD